MKTIEVIGREISIANKNKEEFISLTDIPKYKNPDSPADVIKNWLRNRNTIELLGLWEKLYNSNFKLGEFDQFKMKLVLGKLIVKQLSDELQSEFVGIKGFSERNLWNMRNYFLAYRETEKLQTLSAQISWSHNVKILQKVKDSLAQQFYIQATIQNHWSVRVLDHQIDNQSYEKTLSSQHNFENTLPEEIQTTADTLVKDEYTFDFLDLNEEHSENQLEHALIQKVREFLIQMGPDFTFMGNQYKLTVDNEEYYIELLLYH